jgi:hypothetical protein
MFSKFGKKPLDLGGRFHILLQIKVVLPERNKGLRKSDQLCHFLNFKRSTRFFVLLQVHEILGPGKFTRELHPTLHSLNGKEEFSKFLSNEVFQELLLSS